MLKMKNYKLYLVTLFVWMSFNVIIYNYLVYSLRQQDLFVLGTFQDNIKTLLLGDLQVALSNTTNKNFLLLGHLTTKDRNTGKVLKGKEQGESITAKPYSIEITNQKGEQIFDLQVTKEKLEKLLPSYITYRILINGHNIALNKHNNYDHAVSKSYFINEGNDLFVELGIDKESSYANNNLYKIYKTLLITMIASFITSGVFLYIYLRTKNRLDSYIEQLEEGIYQTTRMRRALLLNKETEQKLKMIFIQKSTEMYVSQQLESEINSGDTVDSTNIAMAIKEGNTHDYLFPICLTDLSSTEIDITELMQLLKDYFGYHFMHTVLKLEKQIDKVRVDCGKEVLYQVIFSLIYNLVRFMEEQSNTPKSIILNFTQEKILITYDSFPLTEQIMINLSDTLFREKADVFLLSCRKIFKSLKEHKLNYKIYDKSRKNIVEISLRAEILVQNKDNVVKFEKYKKNNK